MAALVATYNGDLRARDWLKRGIPLPRTGPIDTRHELRKRIRALAGLWEDLCRTEDVYTTKRQADSTGVSSGRAHARKELFRPIAMPQVAAESPPPPYEDCSDPPPDYTSTEALATVQLNVSAFDGPGKDAAASNGARRSATDEIDFTSPAGIRSHANKKAKKAAKATQKDKWAGSDDEGEKPPDGDGEGGAGDGAGGDGGFGAGGDGGDPPGDGGNGAGDGGDGGDDWTAGGTTGKGRKKKKKSAWEEYEAEEAAKKAEGEAAVNVDATPVAAAVPEVADDWGAFASVGGKKKKGKKGQPEPEPIAEPVLDTIDLDASGTLDATPATATEPDPGDEWGFSSGKKRKGAKKGKNDPLPPPPPPAPENDMKFDDVSLNDDKAAPKLDLDFGLDAPAAENKSSGFSFGGGWGGGWGSGGGGGGGATGGGGGSSSWGFGGVEEQVAEIPKADESWSFGATSGGTSTKKDRKKKGGFDFDFDDLAGDAGETGAPPGDLASPAKEEPPLEPDPWSFASTNTPIPPGGKKTKKGTRKGAVEEPAVIDVPLPPPPPPVEEFKEDVKEEDSSFGGFGMSAKDRKKAKKGGKVAQTPVEEPVVVVVPEPVAEPQATPMDDFASLSVGKKDKRKKKGAFDDWPAPVEEKVVDVPPPPPPAPLEDPPPVEDSWGGFSAASSKKKKGGKRGALDDVAPPTPAVPDPIVEEKAGGDDWFGGWGGKTATDDPPADESNFLQPDAIVEPKVDEIWTTGTKKKGLKKDKVKGIVEVVDPSPGTSILLPESIQEKSAEEETSWSAFGTVGKKDKKKAGRKGVMEAELPPAPPPPGQGLDDLNFDTTGAAALVDVNETPADDFIPSSKKSKLKKGAKGVVEPPIDTKLSKTKSRESKYSPDDIVDIIDEAPTPPLPPPPPEPVVESPREEKKASKWGVGSLWGSSSSKTSSKSTKEKEREAKEAAEREAREKAEADKAAAADEQRKADEALFAAAIGEDPNEILEIIDEAPPKKSAKDSKFKAGKLSKAEGKPGKSSKKSEPKEEPIAAVVDEPAPDPIMDIMDEPAPAEAPSAAGWGFWGAGLKPSKSGKKATPAAEMSLSKEIGSPDAWANEGPELTERPKMPEVTFAEDGLKSATSPLSTRLTKDTPSTSKSKSKSSSSTIQDRIKALQGDSAGPTTAKKSPDSRKSKDRDAAPPPAPAPEPEPLTTAEAEPVIVVPPSPEERRSSKKSTSKTSSSRKDRKDLAPLDTDPVSVPPLPSTSPLPGGFPTDDFMPDMPAAPPKPSVKDKKSSKPSKTAKQSKSEAQPVIVDAPPAPETFDDLMGLDDTELPTPPPEKPSKDDSKGHKKERPKVVRDQGSNSWGFWGATPPAKPSSKKDSRSKDGASSPVKERPAGLSRSKSARKPTDKDPAEKASKSSGSDKDIKSASKARPSSSRGQSFGAMFGLGSTPSRSKSTRIPSSRRQSNAVDDSGMMSPPPEERSRAEVSDKAAKLMGMSRSKSTRDKPKARKVPDPYAIDSDDMIMVDGPEDSAKDMPPAEKPSTGKDRSRRSKRESTMMSGGLGGADDAVMVDAPRDESKIDDLAFDVRPPLVRRATTSAKKPGLMGGILGAFSSRPAAPDRRQSKTYDSEDGMSRRKRGSVYDDDRSKRLRRDDRKVNRARKPSDADGLTDGAPLTEAEDPEAREARRAERRARRDREAAEDEARAARRAEREEARKAKAREEEDRLRQEDEEREARRKEERRAKRAERETRRAEEDRLAREEEAQAAERRERRRERERQRTETEPAPRPTTSDRRRSYAAERPEDEEARRVRREDRRLRRSVDPSAVAATDKERPRTSRRRSDYPAPVDDYFDKRNGEPAPPAQNPNGGDEPDADGRPYIKAGGDKTTSWVHSVNESPPPPPPVEGTIVDAPAHFAADDGVPALHPFEETTATTAREMRHKRAKERDGYGEEPERRRRSRRERDGEGIKSSSGGSGQDRQQSYYGGPVNSIGFNEMGGVKSWDGRPAVQRSESKRGSWFKKIAGGL